MIVIALARGPNMEQLLFTIYFDFFFLFKITCAERVLAPVLRFVLGKLGRFFSRGVM